MFGASLLMRLRSSFWAGFLLLILLAMFLAAGFWQVARAHFKDRMQAEIQAAAAEPPIHAGAAMLDPAHAHLRRLEARGTWVPEHTVLIDNKMHDGVVGYEVVTPLRLAEGEMYLLVNRGWVRAPQLRSELPKIATPSGSVAVEGVARVPTHRFIELGKDVVSGPVWQNLTIERYAEWSKLPVQPVMLYQQEAQGVAASDGLLRADVAPEASTISADRHRGYALTWFSLAGVTVVLGALSWLRNRNKPND
jgi:surfeit locus 1 family protein